VVLVAPAISITIRPVAIAVIAIRPVAIAIAPVIAVANVFNR